MRLVDTLSGPAILCEAVALTGGTSTFFLASWLLLMVVYIVGFWGWSLSFWYVISYHWLIALIHWLTGDAG
jgi:hypothetical protein